MARIADTGQYESKRADMFYVDPRALVVDYSKNVARGGEPIEVDDKLISLARDMMPRKGAGDCAEGTTGQVHPITCRALPDKRLEVVMGFRRMRAAMWLIESGECPDFKIKYLVSRMNDAEAALSNIVENMHREDPRPIQQAHAIRALTEDYAMELPVVAERLGLSLSWCHELLKLIDLPAAIQESVSAGKSSVGAALQIAAIPDPKTRVKVFNELKEAKGKIKAADVKAKRRNLPATNGTPAPAIGRRMIDVVTMLRERVADKAPGHDLAQGILDFISGRLADEAMARRWDRAFDREGDGDDFGDEE